MNILQNHPQSPTSTQYPLIGLSGHLRAGKDAIGDYLVSQYGYQKLGMSDALNEALLAIDPWVSPDYDVTVGYSTVKPWEFLRYSTLHAAIGYVESKKHTDVRTYLQKLGTEVGRDMIDPDVWVDIASKKISALRARDIPVVITAIRFPNEIDMLHRLGGISIWVDRPEESRLEGVSRETSTSHASEQSLSRTDCDYLVSNTGTLDDLYAQVRDFLA